MQQTSKNIGYLIVILVVGSLMIGTHTQTHAQTNITLTQVAQVRFPPANLVTFPSATALDVWGEGDIAVVAGGTFVHLVDLSDIDNPKTQTIELPQGEETFDAKLQDGILYVGLQYSDNDNLLIIYDITDFENPQRLSTFSNDIFAGAHNIFVQEKVVFIGTLGGDDSPNLSPDNINGGAWLVDVSDPSQPKDIGQLVDNSGQSIEGVHDITVIGNRLYVAGWYTGFWMIDLENLDNPQELSYEVIGNGQYTPYPPAIDGTDITWSNNHNIWPNENGTIAWTTDEIMGEGVRAFDISNPKNIQLLDFFELGLNSLPHNVVVDGDIAYVSYYLEGLRVLQLMDNKIVEILHINTPGNVDSTSQYDGAFGVFVLGDYVLVGDTLNGLLVFEKQLTGG